MDINTRREVEGIDDINARREVEDINIIRGPQQTLNTRGWMLLLHTFNLFLVHLCTYCQQLFEYFLHLSRTYIETT